MPMCMGERGPVRPIAFKRLGLQRRRPRGLFLSPVVQHVPAGTYRGSSCHALISYSSNDIQDIWMGHC